MNHRHFTFVSFGLALGLAGLAAGCGDATAPAPAPSQTTTVQRALIAVPGDQPTIQAAIDAAGPGEIITVAAGSYQEDLVLKSDITLQGVGADTIVFGTISGEGVTDVVLEDFALDGSLSVSDAAGVVLVNGDGDLRGLSVRGGYAIGIRIVRDSGAAAGLKDTVIDAADVTGCSSAGIELDGAFNATVVNSVVRLNALDGVRVVDNAGTAGNISLSSNLLFANGHSTPDGAGLWTNAASAINVTNTIVTSNNQGLYCSTACANDNDIVWGNTTNYGGSAVAGSSNIKLDPRFNNPGEGDFTLRFDSPAIDMGQALGAPDHDAAGTTRPLGGGYDIGPFEFLSANTSIQVAITEVMSNPLDEGTGEYVELHNYGTVPVDVLGYKLTDGDGQSIVTAWQSGGTTTIEPGGYAVVLDPDYDGVTYDIPSEAVLLTVLSSATIGNGLSTSDPIKLLLPDGKTPVDTLSFPFNAGNGVSIEKDSVDDGDTPTNWVASPCGHSPGKSNCASLPPNVSLEVLIAINEVMANPLDETTGEFVELFNFGADPVDLTGMSINDGDSSDVLVAMAGGSMTLQPGQFAVVLDPDYVDGTYTIPAGTLLLTVESSSTIGSGIANNDPVSLLDAVGTVIDTYTHTFDAGNGTSVEKVDPTIGDIGSNFAASTCASGASPGAVNCVTADGASPVGEKTLALTEVMANALDEDTGEFIEIFNYGTEPIDLAGYRIDDGDSEEKLEAFGGGSTVIEAGGYAVIVDAEYAGQYAIPGGVTLLTTDDTTIGSGLSTTDPIRLRAPTGATPIDTYFFPFNPGNGVSAEKIDLVVGDVPQNWVASPCNASPGMINCADGGLGGGSAPVSTTDVVISEVMANALDEDTGEFVELFNAGPVGVDVGGWQLSDGDTFDTLEGWQGGGTVIAPGQFAVIVDPEYAGEYTIPGGALMLTTGDTTLGNSLSTADPITLYEADGLTVVDAFSFPYNPGNGVSVEKVTLTSGDVSDNWVSSSCLVSAGDSNDTASPGARNCADPYGGISGTNTLGQPCPFGAADCLSGLCAIELLTGNTFCTESCTVGPDSCPSGLSCTEIGDTNYPDVCVPVSGGATPNVKLNEVLYDAVSTDTEVFVELWGTPNTILDGLELVGINGATGKVYVSIPLTGQIGADGFFVIAHPSATGAIAAAADMLTSKIDLQNGPDSVQLRFAGGVVDALGYGDFSGAVFGGEGAASPDVSPGESLARTTDGGDTDDNASDFSVATTPTPGAAN